MNVFRLRKRVVEDYARYVGSFIRIADPRIEEHVAQAFQSGALWPEPLLQVSPAFQEGESLDDLVAAGELHPEALRIFAKKAPDGRVLAPLRLHRHQVDGHRAGRAGDNYVLTTGTGSGKSLAYIVPIVDHVLRLPRTKSIKAIVIYPMNALANSQLGELRKFLCLGYPGGAPPVTFAQYTGQQEDEERNAILADPPDILLTNYVMMELLLTRPKERDIIGAAQGLRFLVLDEMHTYRGRQGADVALLVRRVREACRAPTLVHVGTSATLSTASTWSDQQTEVARVASDLFGSRVKPERVIGETLRRVTSGLPADEGFHDRLRDAIEKGETPPISDPARFVEHPLAIWIEAKLGVREDDTGRLVRATPRALSGEEGAAALLADDTGLPSDVTVDALRRALLAGYQCRDADGRPMFAFRLHQFVSKGDRVYASPESEHERHVTLDAQQFVPGSDKSRALLPLAFCRECGQEYYVVRHSQGEDGRIRYLSRELSDRVTNDDGDPGFLFIKTGDDAWPAAPAAAAERLPDSWVEIEDGVRTVRRSYRDRLPRELFLSGTAVEGDGAQRAHFIRAPFLVCLRCGVAYDAHQSSDYGKLATLGSEGRSTATTILTLSSIRQLRADEDLDDQARKLLSFTDNRQDASLQAGHFNDFVEVGLLRSALARAVSDAGASGIRHDELPLRVFETLALPLALYAINPAVEYAQRDETERALRDAIGYYLYRDLRRGWRVTQPNLEQSGLLEISYASLDRFCGDEPRWQTLHAALAAATSEARASICRVLLDYLRRELAIRVSFLDPTAQEAMRERSRQYLIAPWAIDEHEKLERSRIVFPRSRGGDRADGGQLYVSPLGGFALYLKRPGVLPNLGAKLKTADVEAIIRDLVEALTVPGLLQRVVEARGNEVPGYQLNASGMVWCAGDGTRAFHDPVRVPNVPDDGLKTNRFFVDFYRQSTDDMKLLTAREHTAQVPSGVRRDREEAFREARLPVLYCSPTMELGVDITQLNVVNMRNVPPTPANYAQRSGRAGRSGQPAFVFTYCSSGSPHDRYFFKRPEKMVMGAVTPPRIDLANEDLLRAHVHAMWLGVARLDLGQSLAEILDVVGDKPTLELRSEIRAALHDGAARAAARSRAHDALGAAIAELVGSTADVDDWIDRVLRELPTSFEHACERWRGLFRSALRQIEKQSRIINDVSKDPEERKIARRLRDEAEAQRTLLVETRDAQQSDFYSYRYLASEGFLPGYNFPRLPLSAYLPGSRRRRGSKEDDFLTRPRFLAISEFGPRSIVYHEGARFVVNQVILPVDGDESTLRRRAVQCAACGYLHPLRDEAPPDLCERCRTALPPPMDNLFRMQNVSTRRRDRINSDEEERFRFGYEIKSGVRFAQRRGVTSAQEATLVDADGSPLATLTYGHAATIWRLNIGWRRRARAAPLGYLLDLERGYWARGDAAEDPDPEDRDDPLSPRTERVIPYVEDTRNCLLIEPARALTDPEMATLEAALKAAIRVEFQLEDRELASEPLPGGRERRLLLLYEASEGGAGVLRRLAEDGDALAGVARAALELCHFDPDTLVEPDWTRDPERGCEAGCYDCLLSYFNQRDHRLIDRRVLPELIGAWRGARVIASPTALPRDEHIDRLRRLTQSGLERQWLERVVALGLRLPSAAQTLIESCSVRPDFVYGEHQTVVFVDGPHHDAAEQATIDARQAEALEDRGFTVIRFHHGADWDAIFARHAGLFGRPAVEPKSVPPPSAPSRVFDPDAFDDVWHAAFSALCAQPGIEVRPGEEVTRNGRVIDLHLATVVRGDRALRLVDAASPMAGEVEAALGDAGHQVLRVRHDLPDLAARILAGLGG